MEKWWNERCINRRDWILDHLKELSLTIEEIMVVLMIDFMNEYQIPITHGILADKLKKDSDEIDDILSHLSAKGYLALQFQNGKILFNIDGVFAQDTAIYLDKYNICVRAGNHCAKMIDNVFNISNTVRISLSFYNTKEEVDLLINVLKNSKNIWKEIL